MAKWKEIKKYLVGEMPDGWFYIREKASDRATIMCSFLILATLLLFVWLAINAPIKTTEVAGKEVIKAGGLKWRWLGMVYAVMGAFSIGVGVTDWVLSKRFRPIAVPMPGGGDWSMLEVIVVGMAIAGGTMLVSSFAFATTGSFAFTLEVFPKLPLTNWLVVGFSIPIMEEVFFGTIISTSFTENYGLLVGLTIPSFIFAIFHWGVYGLTPSLLIPLFLFRSLATLSVIFSRSWVPGLTGHILINTVSIMAMF